MKDWSRTPGPFAHVPEFDFIPLCLALDLMLSCVLLSGNTAFPSVLETADCISDSRLVLLSALPISHQCKFTLLKTISLFILFHFFSVFVVLKNLPLKKSKN